MGRQRLQVENYNYAGEQARLGVPTSAAGDNQLEIHRIRVRNSTGSAGLLGACIKLSSANYELYAAETGNADLNAIKDGTTTSIVDNDNNDGFIVESPDKFNLIGFDVTQADGGGATYAFQYWNGSSWTALTGIQLGVSFSATGSEVMLCPTQLDWAQATSVSGSGASVYALRVIATTAGVAVVQANDLWVGRLIEFSEGVADNAFIEVEFSSGEPLLLKGGESIMPVFASANNDNSVSVHYKFNE